MAMGRVGSVSGKRNFGIAEIWRKLRGTLTIV
jgi:hypothetical protein